MSQGTLTRIVGLGAVTGMRSMAGVAALARARDGMARPLMTLLAVGEMCADKTPAVGNRTDALPLGGRALMGAVVGAVVASEHDENPLLGGLIGATTALIATHLAFQLRRRLPVSNVAGGLLEDALVLTVVSLVGAHRGAGEPAGR
jgi:uncharacterized membrane protein